MKIQIIDTKKIVDIHSTFANRLIESGKAKIFSGEKINKTIPTPENIEIYLDSNGNKYTPEQFNNMDKRTALYKELKALNK